jgi:hypothetical protein
VIQAVSPQIDIRRRWRSANPVHIVLLTARENISSAPKDGVDSARADSEAGQSRLPMQGRNGRGPCVNQDNQSGGNRHRKTERRGAIHLVFLGDRWYMKAVDGADSRSGRVTTASVAYFSGKILFDDGIRPRVL